MKVEIKTERINTSIPTFVVIFLIIISTFIWPNYGKNQDNLPNLQKIKRG